MTTTKRFPFGTGSLAVTPDRLIIEDDQRNTATFARSEIRDLLTDMANAQGEIEEAANAARTDSENR